MSAIDPEAQPLLVDSSESLSVVNDDNNDSNLSTIGRSNNSLMITASLLSAVIILGGMALYNSPLNQFADNIASEFTHLSASGPSLFSSSALSTHTTSQNENSNNIIYLDRHKMDCGTSIFKGFKMLHGPKYEYQCYASQLGARTAAWGYNTGWQTAGGNIYLDRQHAWCPDRTLMSRIEAKAKHDWGWKFTYDFTCSRYDYEDFACTNHYTAYNDAGDGIIYLDRHSVYCPDNKGLNGFEVQTSWGRVRYHYKCCSANGAAPTATPTASPSQNPTLQPTLSPTIEPTAKPSREPTTEPTLAPVVSPTFAPSKEPIASPTLEPTPEPSVSPIAAPTQEPTVGDKIPKKPANMSDKEWEDALEYEKKKASKAEALPEPAVVEQAPNVTNVDKEGEGSDEQEAKEKQDKLDADAIPANPIVKAIENEIADNQAEAIEAAKEKEDEAVALAKNESIPEVQRKTPSPDALIPSGSDAIRYCAYTHTKVPGYVKVPVGCTLAADENVDALQDGEKANAVLVCGLAEKGLEEMDIKMNQARLNSFAIMMAGGISYIKPGEKTSATFFNNGDFTGQNYTYTSGFHPAITNSANFNDNINSLIVTTRASEADFRNIVLPDVCSDQ